MRLSSIRATTATGVLLLDRLGLVQVDARVALGTDPRSPPGRV